MDRQSLFAWVQEQYGSQPDYPWQDDNAVLRHQGNQKWFGVVLSVSPGKLGLPGKDKVDLLNVKCDPLLIGSLRTRPGVLPAYHMNKENWVSLRLDGTMPAEEICTLVAMSYDLTKPQRKKR